MAKTIVQKVVFKNTTPKALYDLYMDSKKHSIATAGAAKISAKEGGKFSAFDGYCFGKNVRLVKDKLIVQTWRGSNWPKEEVDSIFSISLEQKGKDTILHAVHLNVPDNEAKGIDQGWHDYYWKPWKSYLKGTPIKQAKEM